MSKDEGDRHFKIYDQRDTEGQVLSFTVKLTGESAFYCPIYYIGSLHLLKEGDKKDTQDIKVERYTSDQIFKCQGRPFHHTFG